MFSLSRPLEKAHENRGVPFRALGWSLGVHALVLGSLASQPFVEMAGVAADEPLRATLRPEILATAAAVPVPAAMRPVRMPNAHAGQKTPEPVRSAVTPKLTFAEAREEVGQQPAASPGGMVAPLPAAAAAKVALPAPAPSQGLDAAGLRQYRLALAGEAKHFRRYPEAARREGLVGKAEVRVSVSAGTQRQAELVRSSGHALLDAAALDMLRAAAARTLLPESLRGQEFAVLMPVVFEVED